MNPLVERYTNDIKSHRISEGSQLIITVTSSPSVCI
jgi:hypothetical protein